MTTLAMPPPSTLAMLRGLPSHDDPARVFSISQAVVNSHITRAALSDLNSRPVTPVLGNAFPAHPLDLKVDNMAQMAEAFPVTAKNLPSPSAAAKEALLRASEGPMPTLIVGRRYRAPRRAGRCASFAAVVGGDEAPPAAPARPAGDDEATVPRPAAAKRPRSAATTPPRPAAAKRPRSASTTPPLQNGGKRRRVDDGDVAAPSWVSVGAISPVAPLCPDEEDDVPSWVSVGATSPSVFAVAQADVLECPPTPIDLECAVGDLVPGPLSFFDSPLRASVFTGESSPFGFHPDAEFDIYNDAYAAPPDVVPCASGMDIDEHLWPLEAGVCPMDVDDSPQGAGADAAPVQGPTEGPACDEGALVDDDSVFAPTGEPPADNPLFAFVPVALTSFDGEHLFGANCPPRGRRKVRLYSSTMEKVAFGAWCEHVDRVLASAVAGAHAEFDPSTALPWVLPPPSLAEVTRWRDTAHSIVAGDISWSTLAWGTFDFYIRSAGKKTPRNGMRLRGPDGGRGRCAEAEQRQKEKQTTRAGVVLMALVHRLVSYRRSPELRVPRLLCNFARAEKTTGLLQMDDDERHLLPFSWASKQKEGRMPWSRVRILATSFARLILMHGVFRVPLLSRAVLFGLDIRSGGNTPRWDATITTFIRTGCSSEDRRGTAFAMRAWAEERLGEPAGSPFCTEIASYLSCRDKPADFGIELNRVTFPAELVALLSPGAQSVYNAIVAERARETGTAFPPKTFALVVIAWHVFGAQLGCKITEEIAAVCSVRASAVQGLLVALRELEEGNGEPIEQLMPPMFREFVNGVLPSEQDANDARFSGLTLASWRVLTAARIISYTPRVIEA